MTGVTEYTSAAVSDRGLSPSRPHNEDSYLELPQYGLFAVADGVGGAQAGEVASQMAVEILSEAFVNRATDSDPEDVMKAALQRANEAIFQMSNDLPQLSSMATTIAAVHVSGDTATIAHVGDSRVYRVDQTGKLIRETDDHSVVEEEVRAGRMTPEQALNHPSRNVISRALGAEDTVQPDIKCIMVQPATTFLLCSDGITRHIEDSEIESLLNYGRDPADICARMKEICFNRGAEDNLTAVIVQFAGERVHDFIVQDDDIEEVTVAGVRPTISEDGAADLLTTDKATEFTNQVEEEQEAPTLEYVDLAPPATGSTEDTEDYLMTEPEAMIESPASEEVPQESTATGSAFTVIPERSVDSAEGAESVSRPSSNFLNTFGLLLLGLLIGAVGTYLLGFKYQPVVEAPAITEQKSSNVPLTAFEDTRRLVDADPVRYLNAKAASPQEADDHFWLGRALLLTGKPVEAKRQFEEARRLLPTVAEPTNVRTLANEIAMGIVIADNQQASEALAKELTVSTGDPAANANSNSSLPVQ